MRFYINLLSTYYPDRDPPYDIFYQQVLEQVCLAEELGWAGRQGYHIMTVAHPHPPESVGKGVEAWREGLVAQGHDPSAHHCQLHLRIYVNQNSKRAEEIGTAAIARYDDVSRIGRKEPLPPGSVYDWQGMLASG